jgi:hypothetical protein
MNVIGHHDDHTYMSDPNSKSLNILSDGPVKDILRPGEFQSEIEYRSLVLASIAPYRLSDYR